MSAKNVYSFLSFNMALVGPGGSISLGNGAGVADEGVSFEPTGAKNTMQIGADGKGQHSLHADKSGKITLRLLKTSATNGVLMQMYNLQTATAVSHGQNTITGNDSVRGDTVVCQQVAFAKRPSVLFGKEAGLIEWEFEAIYLNITLAQ